MTNRRLIIPLFSPATGTFGGLTRAIAIARAAQQSGFEVAFCASGEMERILSQAGFRVYTMPAPTMFGLPKPVSRRIAQRAQKGTIPVPPGKSIGNIWFVHVFSGIAQRRTLLKLVRSELDAFDDFHPDKVFTDLDLAAYLAASIKGIPIAGAFQGVMLEGRGSLFWKVVRSSVQTVLDRYNLPVVSPEELTFGRKVLKIIPSIPELEGVDSNRSDICYVGQMLGEIGPTVSGGFQPEAGKKYIFVYVGTGALSLDQIRRVLPGLLADIGEWRAVVGGVDIPSPERIGPVQFYPYISAQSLLPHCSWTICHGGQNTIIQSLLHGVPLLVFPGPIFERRFNACKVQECRAGVMGELPDFNREWLLTRLEHWENFSPQAGELGKKISEYGGAQQAVEAIASWNGS